MKQLSLIPNLTNSEHPKCEICVEVKHFKKPFKTIERSSELLELIHSDLGDFKNTMSKGGKRYYITFIDDYSRYTRVYLQNSKDEVENMFILQWFMNMVQDLISPRLCDTRDHEC